MDSIKAAQQDMREAYAGGATGALTSATAWLAAGFVAALVDTKAGIWTLIIGGMFIFPVSVVLSKVLGRTGKHAQGNPLGPLALEGTVWMLLGILLAIGCSFHRVDWFFPAMLLVIGGRYLTFSTLYGMRVYWIFGGTLAAVAFPLLATGAPAYAGAFTGALIEYAFGALIYRQFKQRDNV